MFNIGAGEMILIALVLLIAVGPEQLPGVIRRTGKVVGQLKNMSDNLRRDFNASLDEIERAADVKSWAGSELESTADSIRKAAINPFKTDGEEIDGSTKVTDMWSNPPAADDSADDAASEDDGEGDDAPDEIAEPESVGNAGSTVDADDAVDPGDDVADGDDATDEVA